MKSKLLILLFISFTGLIYAQDTIFVKNGQVIPAIIVEKNNTEIKYRKFGPPESAAIYSIFVSDISSIHFSDGIIADYSAAGKAGTENKPSTAFELAGTMRAVKWSFGLNLDYFKRDINDELLIFWQDKLGNPQATIDGNPLSFPIIIKTSFVLGNSGRNWMGDELQIKITPVDAISASNTTGTYEIRLRNFYYNIVLFYGHTLNHKKNLIGIIEPGLDFGFMSGYIKLNNTKYDITGNLGVGFHMALGADWFISKRLTASMRGGYRWMNIDESHKSTTSTTGYSSFYVDPTVSDELLTVSWNGPYASFGLTWSFYTKLKGAQTD